MPLIVIEGCDGSGKTTTVKALQSTLTNAVFLREPGSTPLSEALRDAMKANDTSALARQLIMHGSRLEMVEHFNNFSDPNTLYVIDRYVPSTLVYGHVDGVHLTKLVALTKLFPVPIPYMTFILDPGWDVIQKRLARRLDSLEGDMYRLRSIHTMYRKLEAIGYFANSIVIENEVDPYIHINTILDITKPSGLTRFVK